MKRLCILNGSPHVQGVADSILSYVHADLAGLPVQTEVLRLREKDIQPCHGCRNCTPEPHTCVLDTETDEAASLFRCLEDADLVLFCAPIYFYTLPACTVALIDRAQRLFMQGDRTVSSPGRPTFLLLHAARTRGERLFCGAVLTLTYFFRALHRRISTTCLLRGLDTRDDLLRNASVRTELSLLVQTIRTYLD